MTIKNRSSENPNRYRYGLTRAILVFLIALILQFIATGINPFATVIAKMRNASLDTLMEWVYEINSPNTNSGVASVWFVGIDEYYENQRLKDQSGGLEIGIARARLAEVIRNLEELEPRAIFLDLALGETADENNQKSLGDTLLLDALDIKKERDFPILVPGRFIAQEDISDSPSVCPVSSDLYLDGDGLVRRISLSARNLTYSGVSILDYGAVFYLERLAHTYGSSKFDGWRWKNCEDMRQSLSGNFDGTLQSTRRKTYQQMNNRTVFRSWDWQVGNPSEDSKLTVGKSLWSKGHYISAQALLEQTSELNEKSAIFIIGHSNPQSRFTRDIYGTPVGPMTGAEIHYHSLMTKLHHQTFDTLSSLLSPIMLLSYLLMLSIIFIFSAWFRDLDNILEFGITWLAIFIPAVYLLHRFGFYMDYVLPLFVLEFFDSAYQAVRKWGNR